MLQNNLSEISEKKLDINFNHRKSLMVDDGSSRILFDTIDVMACRALAILESLSTQYVHGSSQQIGASSMYWNLNSVIMELKDIQELVNQDKNNLA